MSGQPNIPPWLTFDVTNIEIIEPSGAILPSNIVPVNSPFTLRTTFKGDGYIWDWLKNLNVQWEAKFSADAIGVEPGITFPVVNGNLAPGSDTFTTHIHILGIADAGIYEIACIVRFPLCRGLTGYFKPLAIEVYP
jgi:hypothetical protein